MEEHANNDRNEGGDEEDAVHGSRSDGACDPNRAKNPSESAGRRCACDSAAAPRTCRRWTALAAAIHIPILAAAILCLLPMGVMTSVIRSYVGGIATLVWLIYCCVMAVSNMAFFAHRHFRTKDDEMNNHDEEIHPRVLVPCQKMGCICFGPSSAASSCFKVALLFIEGVLLLMPIFASASSYSSLNGGTIDEVFPNASNLARDPRTTAFWFGQYMLPGAFSQFGGYNNNKNARKTFKYKDGCRPECELDIHIPNNSGAMPASGYPIIFHVHGGGWDYGDKSSPLLPITYWLDRNYAFVSVQYRFPSQTPGGATVFEQLDDVEAAFDYVTSGVGAEGEGLDASRVLFLGDSAGGHLACVVAYRSGAPAIRGVANLYGATEWEHYVDGGGGSLERLFGRVLPPDDGAREDDYRDASCSTYATSDSAPILTMHGTWDTVVPLRMNEHLHSVASSLGVSNLLVKVPLAEHVLEAGFYSIGGQMAIYAMERFAAAQLLG